MFKTVLGIVGVNQGDRDLRAVMDLVAATGSHLSVLVVSLAGPPPIGGYAEVVSDVWLHEREDDKAKLGERLRLARVQLERSGLSHDVEAVYLEVAWADDRIGERARYADLTIVGPDLMANGKLKNAALGGALFQSARPVLLLPGSAKATLQPKNILLAWDSRTEAARAAGCAIELMKGAENVRITLVDPVSSYLASGAEPGADVATYLARHGIKVTVDQLAGGGRLVAEVLNRHAIDTGSDMIVMGAYGHSRLKERIFGGVTKSMIENAEVPILMAH
ncbi:universal stress protein [Rhizobiaceae bacterium n13]|uniref:Universal stress protein n=1 Tax=Ferirhizobium litorale TaxID=2927786 RepID=A0AAE3QIW8_9HYPH|nr:universal stress protein [Fererhizobium litorale]MDI7864469.1 universal stress protein [Fererhizobium litorale]MDI7924780.1 universal stress protein [Fererhizobium litorale]